MPAALAFCGDDRAERLVRNDDGDALDAVADHRVEGGDRQIGVELDVLRHEGGAGLFGGLLGAGDLGDEPWMVAHLVDVADLDVVGGGGAGQREAGGESRQCRRCL